MVRIPHSKDGPSADDWFEAANQHDKLESVTDEIAGRQRDVGSIAVQGAERVVDDAVQARWNNFKAGRSIDAPDNKQAG